MTGFINERDRNNLKTEGNRVILNGWINQIAIDLSFQTGNIPFSERFVS